MRSEQMKETIGMALLFVLIPLFAAWLRTKR